MLTGKMRDGIDSVIAGRLEHANSKNARASIPVIMLTAKSHAGNRILSRLEVGADDYVIKYPFSPERF